jgi:hypothetical protein
MKKFAADRPFANHDAAARKLVEIANGIEGVQEGMLILGGPLHSRTIAQSDFAAFNKLAIIPR